MIPVFVLEIGGASTRPEKFLGDPADWDVAEKALISAVERAGFQCKIKPGEAAFYAPKVVHYAAGFIGLLLAMGLHMTFNYLILNTPQQYILQVFALVWVGVILLLAILEYIKRIKPSR